jgi:hypothetical protein
VHAYKVRPRKAHRGANLISDALPFRRSWYADPNAVSNVIGHAKFYSRSHDAVIRVYDAAGNVIEAHEHKRFQSVMSLAVSSLVPRYFCREYNCGLIKSRKLLLRPFVF